MSKDVERTLRSLLPVFCDPASSSSTQESRWQLLSLATSLLAQSHSQIITLKPEEVIARPYLCAHLACERLKQTLNLPRFTPKPPVPPKVYTKLFDIFNVGLVATPKRGRVPSRKIFDASDSSPTKGRGGPPSNPRIEAGPSHVGTKRAASQGLTGQFKKARLSEGAPHTRDVVRGVIPGWLTDAITYLCEHLDGTLAKPWVKSGVTEILTKSLPKERSSVNGAGEKPVGALVAVERKMGNPLALLTAVFIFVVVKLDGKEIKGPDYHRRKEECLRVLTPYADEMKTTEPEDRLLTTTDVDDWLREIIERRWQRRNWFAKCPKGITTDGTVPVQSPAAAVAETSTKPTQRGHPPMVTPNASPKKPSTPQKRTLPPSPAAKSLPPEAPVSHGDETETLAPSDDEDTLMADDTAMTDDAPFASLPPPSRTPTIPTIPPLPHLPQNSTSKRPSPDGIASRPRLHPDVPPQPTDPTLTLLPGLGTMMTPALDFLSERKLAAYAEWEGKMLSWCRGLEAEEEEEQRRVGTRKEGRDRSGRWMPQASGGESRRGLKN